MNNAFYFIQNFFLFLIYLNFCSNFFDHVGKEFDKKAKVNSKIYDATNL